MNEPTRRIEVPNTMLKTWVQHLKEISEGPEVRLTTNHTDNLERAHDKGCLLASQVLKGLLEVVGDV